MTEARFCGSCGAPLAAGNRFCSSCGAPVSARASLAADVGGNGTGPASAADAPRTAPWRESALGATAAGSGAPGLTGTPPPPASAAWPPSATTFTEGATGSPPRDAPPAALDGPSPTRRHLLDALLSGDWAGAALASGAAVGAMASVALVAVLLALEGEGGLRPTIALTALAVCAGFGGDLQADGQLTLGLFGAAGSASAGAIPLTLTVLGLGVLAAMFMRRLRATHVHVPLDVALAAVRTLAVLAALMLVVALLSRLPVEESTLEYVDAAVSAGIPSTVIGAVLFGAVALALAVAKSGPRLLPPRLRAVRDQWGPAAVAVSGLVLVGGVAALFGLGYTLATEDGKLQQLAFGLLALPNLAVAALLLALGVPVSARSSDGNTLFSGLATREEESLTLLMATDASLWWWLAPVIAGLSVLAVTATLMLRQHTLTGARREGLRFAAVFAAVALAAALLVRVAWSWETSSGTDGSGSVAFNLVLAALVAALWALAALVVAPALAPKLPPALVGKVRQRFGTAPSAG